MGSPASIVVNGRFLGAQVTGLQRTARSLVGAATDAGLHAEVLAPAGTLDAMVDRTGWSPPGPGTAQAWEQLVLPFMAHGRRILSLTNTAPLLARRSVVWIHDLAPTAGPQWFAPSMRAYARLVRTAARRAELVLTVSPTMATELGAIGAAPVEVIRPAVDPVFRPASPEAVADVRRRCKIDRPYVVFVGWADPRKGLGTALAAHEAVRADVPHDLVLIGRSHPTFAPVRPPTGEAIVTLGYVGEDDLVALLTGASALLYPTRYEGYGLPPLEAWSCGTPALVSDIPVMRSTTGGQGLLLDPDDIDAWAAGLAASLEGRLVVPEPPAWTWADAGRRLVDALAALP